MYRKKILITGHTGFKGGWLGLLASMKGFQVFGLSDQAKNISSYHYVKDVFDKEFFLDVSDRGGVERAIENVAPDYVVHMAAESLVRRAASDPIRTSQVNILGSLHVLEACYRANVESVLMVTSDKVYLNREWGFEYRENDRLGGKDPYSFSKAAADIVIQGFIKFKQSATNEGSDSTNVVIARAGNVIGGGDFSADRLIPDCISAWKSHSDAVIRHPRSTRPWQHVVDVVAAYLQLVLTNGVSNRLNGQAFNVALNEHPMSVRSVVEKLAGEMNQSNLVKIDETDNELEASLLSISSARLASEVGFNNRISQLLAINWTAEWYNQYINAATEQTLRHIMESQLVKYDKQDSLT